MRPIFDIMALILLGIGLELILTVIALLLIEPVGNSTVYGLLTGGLGLLTLAYFFTKKARSPENL